MLLGVCFTRCDATVWILLFWVPTCVALPSLIVLIDALDIWRVVLDLQILDVQNLH